MAAIHDARPLPRVTLLAPQRRELALREPPFEEGDPAEARRRAEVLSSAVDRARNPLVEAATVGRSLADGG